MNAIQQSVIEHLRRKSLSTMEQVGIADIIETMTIPERLEVLEVVDAEDLSSPRNLSYDYKTQRWIK